jgi:hypothetical protein
VKRRAGAPSCVDPERAVESSNEGPEWMVESNER